MAHNETPNHEGETMTATRIKSGPAPKPVTKIEDFGNGFIICWKI